MEAISDLFNKIENKTNTKVEISCFQDFGKIFFKVSW